MSNNELEGMGEEKTSLTSGDLLVHFFLFSKNRKMLMRSLCCLSVYSYPRNLARQQLAKYFPAATNTHATVEELLDAPFYLRSVSYQTKIGYASFFKNFTFLFNDAVSIGTIQCR